jgi:hypothetical protein
MPFSFSDVKKSLLDIFAQPNGLLGNSFTVAYILGLLVCIIVIFLMRNDEISDGKVKLFKLFIYSSILAACLIICQNTILIKDIESRKSSALTSHILNDGIQTNTNSYMSFKPNSQIPVQEFRPILTTGGNQSVDEQVHMMLDDSLI